MGVVYRAWDPILKRLVALKTMVGDFKDNPDLLKRFYREAQSAGGLRHYNIVTIYDLGVENNQPFIAMEFLEGSDLQSLIQKGMLQTLNQIVHIMRQCCDGLHYAHCPGNRPPGCQAGQRLRPGGRDGQNRRFRHRHGGLLHHDPHRHGHGHRHLHVAGAGPGQGDGRPLRPVLPGHHPLRDADRAETLPRREHSPRSSTRSSTRPPHRSGTSTPTARHSWSSSCTAAWKRTATSATPSCPRCPRTSRTSWAA